MKIKQPPTPPASRRKSGLTPLQLVLLGKGVYAKTKPVNAPAWRGAADGGSE